MRLSRSIAAVLFLAAAGLSASAQPAAGRPPAGNTAAAPAAQRPAVSSSAPATIAPGSLQIAVIDIQAFGDQKAGIGRLLNAYTTLEREFQPRRTELQTLRTRYEALGKEYENLQKGGAAVAPDSLAKKLDEIQTLEKEIKRKQEDAQQAVERREGELTGPVWDDINGALRAFAAQRGISLIFEKSKLAGNGLLFVVNDNMDITRAFISEYNTRNPATASAAPGTR
jgi:Skp family chaperone for outer membrane proteins